jgi:hypothetical protein
MRLRYQLRVCFFNFENYLGCRRYRGSEIFIVLAVTAIAIDRACQTSLVALAVLLLAIRFPAIAPSRMPSLLGLKFHIFVYQLNVLKCKGIPNNYLLLSLLYLFNIVDFVRTVLAGAVFPANISIGKTVAVEFKALRFFATALRLYFQGTWLKAQS